MKFSYMDAHIKNASLTFSNHKPMPGECAALLCIDGALLFGGEEQPEQVVQQSIS